MPTPILQERTQVFARSSFPRPSSQYPLARAELDDPTALFDRDDVPTVRGRTTRSYHVRDDEAPTTSVREPQSHPIMPLRVVGSSVPAPTPQPVPLRVVGHSAPTPIPQPVPLRVVGRSAPPPIPPPVRVARHRLPPPTSPGRERRVTPVELDASYAAALRKLR